MGASHCKDVRCAINQGRGKRLAAEAMDVDAFFCAHFNRVRAWRLSSHCVNPGRNHLNVLAISQETAEKAFRNGASANIPGTDKNDVLHELQATRQTGVSN